MSDWSLKLSAKQNDCLIIKLTVMQVFRQDFFTGYDWCRPISGVWRHFLRWSVCTSRKTLMPDFWSIKILADLILIFVLLNDMFASYRAREYTNIDFNRRGVRACVRILVSVRFIHETVGFCEIWMKRVMWNWHISRAFF